MVVFEDQSVLHILHLLKQHLENMQHFLAHMRQEGFALQGLVR